MTFLTQAGLRIPKVGIKNPILPQLGCCGCVICNECILNEFEKSQSEKYLPRPYCAKKEAFNGDVKAWMLSEEVFGKWKDFVHQTS
jgi:hypothetical protein